MTTYSFVVDSSAFQPVTVQSVCTEIQVYENDQAGTTDYIVTAPNATNSQVTRPAGSLFTFKHDGRKHFQPGEIVGYAKTVSGSITMVQVEY